MSQTDQSNRSIRFKLSLNSEQKIAKSQIIHHPYNFIKGEAGCGKTLLACQIALDQLLKKNVNNIIITRPTVGTEDNGFLPGSLEEKMEPWMVPIKSNMFKLFDAAKIENMFKTSTIEMISLSHFRGRTFDNAVCIIDEFQNLTRAQLQMAIGRLGANSIMIFCGDREQIDLKNPSDSAIHEVSKIEKSQYVYSIILKENHRNPAISQVLKLLNDY